MLLYFQYGMLAVPQGSSKYCCNEIILLPIKDKLKRTGSQRRRFFFYPSPPVPVRSAPNT